MEKGASIYSLGTKGAESNIIMQNTLDSGFIKGTTAYGNPVQFYKVSSPVEHLKT